MTAHPAKYSGVILEEFATWLKPGWLVLDPFGGVGKLAEIPFITAVCVEIEPEWATCVQGDALCLPFADHTFDAVAVSPVYGNRMSDHHNARDTSKRHTYTHYLGHKLHRHNSGTLQFGQKYRQFHLKAWREVARTMKPGGRFILNTSDHIRRGEVQDVTLFHTTVLEGLGFSVDKVVKIGTPRLLHGENHEARVGFETVTVMTKN